MKYLLLAGLAAFSISAQAETVSRPKVVYSCFTKAGKQVLVTQEGQDYRYHFGKPGKWELVFSNPLEQVKRQTTERWDGQGRYGWAAMNMHNDGYDYRLASGWDRISDEHESHMVVNVSKIDGSGPYSQAVCDMQKPNLLDWDDYFLW